MAVQTWDGHCTTPFSFSYNNLTLVQFTLLPNGYYTVVRDRYNENFVDLYNINTQEHTRFSIGYNVNRIGVKSSGEFVVGYYWVENTPALIVFSPEGKILWAHQNDFAKGCLDLNIDSDDNICFLCTPENKLYRILDKNYMWIEEFSMPLANCVGFTAKTNSDCFECPPHCLLIDNFSNYYYWYNETLYPCFVENDRYESANMASFYSDRFSIMFNNSMLALGFASTIDINENITQKKFLPEEALGFPEFHNILTHLRTSDKLGLTYRHPALPNISYVDYGKEIDLIYTAIDEDTEVTAWNYHFNSSHYNKLKVVKYHAEHTSYSVIWSTLMSENNPSVPIQLATYVPNGKRYAIISGFRKFIELNMEYDVQIACYQASKIKYYDGKNELLLPADSLFSYEVLNSSLNFYAIITGQIQEIKKKYNPYTGVPFIHLTVKCMDLILDILVKNTDETNHLKPGTYIQGVFKLTAKIKE